jgi:hypothetical protein
MRDAQQPRRATGDLGPGSKLLPAVSSTVPDSAVAKRCRAADPAQGGFMAPAGMTAMADSAWPSTLRASGRIGPTQ